MRRLSLLVLLLFTFAKGASAQPPVTPTAPRARRAVEIPFTRYTLPNGLTVILHEDHTLPQVVVEVMYRVGSKDEPTGRTGFAHLFEHLMFMGSKNVPYDLEKGAGLFDLLMEQEGGVNNATTSNDITNYFESGPPGLLETFLWLEADRLATLPEVLTQEKLDRQRRIVQNERRQSYENRPYGKAELLISEEMYPPAHPYHHPVIGSHTDLEAAKIEDVRAFFERHYHPANAILVIAGDFDPARARAQVQRYFGWIRSAGKAEAVPPAPPPRLSAEKSKTIKDRVELPRTYLVYHAPADYADGSAECEVIAAVLGQGKSSRLERALRLERQMVQEVSARCDLQILGGLFTIEATARPGHSLAAIEKVIDAEIAALRERGPTAAELERSVAAVETAFALMLEPLFGRSDRLATYELRFDDPGRVAWDLARYGKVTSQGAQGLAKTMLDPRARLRLRVVPEGKK